MNVPGKNNVVSMAMIFIAEPSRLLASASSFESLAIPMLIRLNSYENNYLATNAPHPDFTA